MPAGTVEVFLIGAVGIKDTEIFGKADPYAVLFCGKQKLQSNTASNQGSKPIWNQKFSFYVDDTATELSIKIYNHNILTDDDELGHTVIPLAKVFSECKLPTTSYNVVRPSGRVQGQVKLSCTFTPKNKDLKSPAVVSGPYNAKVHGSPYAPPPAPIKHDPLVGPHGYYRSDSGSSRANSTQAGKRYSYSNESDGSNRPYLANSASGKPYPPPASLYPPTPSMSNSHQPYGMETSPSYHKTDSHDTPMGSLYPMNPTNYDDDMYQQGPYGHAPSTPSFHGAGPMSPASSGYPPYNSGYPQSTRPSPSGPNPYDRYDALSGSFSGLNMSGNSGELPSSGGYPGYPPPEPNPHGNYPSFNPPPNLSKPPAGYPPSAYPMSGYPSQFPGSFSSHGSPAPQGPPPPSGYYPSNFAKP